MVVVLQDDFNRADSTTSPGSPAVGGPWTPTAGTWGVNSGQLYLSASAGGYLLAPGPADANVDFQFTQVLAIGGSSGPHSCLAIRMVDQNNGLATARVSTGTFAFFTITGGSMTQISQEFPSVAGQVIRVVAYEEHIWLYVNGTLTAYLQDPKYDPATRNKIGLRNGATTTGRWDDVIVNTVDARPFAIAAPAQIGAVDLSGAALIGATNTLTPSLYKGRDSALQDESEIP